MDNEAHEWYMRATFNLERLISETGDTPMSKETEYQMKFAKQRVSDRVRAAFVDGQSELNGLKQMLEADNLRLADEP